MSKNVPDALERGSSFDQSHDAVGETEVRIAFFQDVLHAVPDHGFGVGMHLNIEVLFFNIFKNKWTDGVHRGAGGDHVLGLLQFVLSLMSKKPSRIFMI